MASDDSKSLTDTGFWDDFWKETVLPVLPDPEKNYERCYLDLFDAHFRPDAEKTVFEAGCAPGMWLAYFHRRFGYRPFGCDTSPKGVALTQENFRLLEVPGSVSSRDLFAYEPPNPFDVVISIGFIEHFEDPEPALRKSVGLLAPGGTLVLSVPNLTGLNAWLSKPEFLAAHNARTMNLAFFEGLPALLGLEKAWAGYIGGFEPDLVGPHRGAWLRRVALKSLRLLRRLPGTGFQSSLFSGFLAGVYRKPSRS